MLFQRISIDNKTFQQKYSMYKIKKVKVLTLKFNAILIPLVFHREDI